MAESFAFDIAGKVLETLATAAFKEFGLAWGVEDEFQKLQDTLIAIKAVLLDAENQQARNHELTLWIEKFKDACHEVEDLLDEFEIQALRRKVLQRGSTSKKVSHFFSTSNPLAFRLTMAYRVRKVREMLDEIAVNKAKFRLTEKYENNKTMAMQRETYSFVKTSDIIGRDEDKENIIEFLMDPTHEDIPVLPIVGIGGLGKTTLAKLAYNDEKVEKDFHLRTWVCVSEDFDIKQLMIKIIKSAMGDKCSDMNMEELHKVLHDCLSGKKYLLILDDVWTDDKKKWVELKDLLSGGAKGSKIIVTTRSNQVAKITGTVPQYDLENLSFEDSLSLFLKLVFREGEDRQHPNLVKIGEEIVRKCKGVALAVKTLGSLLCSTTAEHDWKNVKDNEIWKLEQKDNDILPALKLSYDQLPSHLRRCFAYCSIFPKNSHFLDYILISFWMAQGLLQSSNENEEPEEIGKAYLNELLSRSFFQEVDDRFPFLVLGMHDLMHDLALLVAQNEVNSSRQRFGRNVRQLSFDSSELDAFKFPNDLSHVRTFLLSGEGEKASRESLLETCISRSKHLRVLDLGWCSFQEMPNCISGLKHLRFLNISENGNIKRLPDFICNFQSLQTLLLGGCKEIEELPKDIGSLISLRTLEVTTKQMSLPEKGIGCLSSLRFLGFYECENLKYLFEDMESLTALRTLYIWDCKNLISLPQGLDHLTALGTLSIVKCKNLDLSKEVAFGGKQDGSLRNLWIGGLPKLEALPQWILLGSTNTLQHLVIFGLENVSTLPTWFQHLTSLQKLTIGYCPKLSSLPEGLQQLTSLKELLIRCCPMLSARCTAKTGEDWPKIANVPSIFLRD